VNEVAARHRETPRGIIAEFRLAHWGRFRAVRLPNGKPVHYPTDKDAVIAAYQALVQHIYRPILRDGEKAGTARKAADLLFPGKGRKPVPVERR
jgi:hypothetical protein